MKHVLFLLLPSLVSSSQVYNPEFLLLSLLPLIPNIESFAKSLYSTELRRQDANLSDLLRVTLAVMKHHDQKQLGEKRLYLAYIS